jgi:hypothetical protein
VVLVYLGCRCLAFLGVLLEILDGPAFRGDLLGNLDVLGTYVYSMVGSPVYVYYDIVASYSTGTCSIRMDYSYLDMIAGCMAILVGASLGRIRDMDYV